jgi:hypothetical protein
MKLMRVLQYRHWHILWVALLPALLSACATHNMDTDRLGKSGVDMVMDLHIQENQLLLTELMEKLYRRNPDELHKTPGATIASRQQILLDNKVRLRLDELGGAEGIHAMNLAFNPGFKGDRVLALMTGLTGMLRRSYGFHTELYLWHTLDENKLHRSARNVEILAWKLKAQLDPEGHPFLITFGDDGIIDNTSFDRLYGKLIANQDMAAKIVADRYSRNISMVIQNTATFIFIPI